MMRFPPNPLRQPLTEQIDIQNQQFRLTFEGHTCFAPGAKTAERVLDVGTGTGVWAIDFGENWS